MAETTTPAQSALAGIMSVPRKAAIEGVIEFPGTVVVEGNVYGDIRCGALTIMERGAVEGTIVADVVIVRGEASGEIFANTLTLKTACSVAADIFHRQLMLEDGCFFEGKSRRHKAPLELAIQAAAIA